MRPLEPLSRDHEIISLITETERSRVLLARRKSDNLEVVVKSLRSNINKPEDFLRIRREYGMLMELAIDGVVKIYDLMELDGSPALVLEYFKGITLQQFLEKYKDGLSLKTFFPIAMHIVSTLSEVHKRGILHLDIKPSNILIAKNRVCLTDFGISRQISGENLFLLEGTLPYMAPEQTGKTSFPIDRRSDLYSLGVVFYEMISGTPVPRLSLTWL
ncbi:serine/threonine protein kinase [Thermospira aquatica]|uniref:Serine/threonine protein kinase n=1 Tax=Thermospira aquatica TaxID=2828656 RepID=A0AAX3BDN6_9SPIR|nr:serine/threonine-protein kinase [Thermospira aquatica]URA10407.1 serine/threonine protein kinase [Thermospira aquatica]